MWWLAFLRNLPRPGGPDDNEATMLELTEAERRPDSRLSCQTTVSPEMAGHMFLVPQPM